MYVANKDLCEELYELSGWDNTTWEHFSTYNGKEFIRARLPGDFKSPVPAYDLGYLLRKLPDNTTIHTHSLKGNSRAKGKYGAFLWHYKARLHQQDADTPEDTACKLAIELFKQGILTK